MRREAKSWGKQVCASFMGVWRRQRPPAGRGRLNGGSATPLATECCFRQEWVLMCAMAVAEGQRQSCVGPVASFYLLFRINPRKRPLQQLFSGPKSIAA